MQVQTLVTLLIAGSPDDDRRGPEMGRRERSPQVARFQSPGTYGALICRLREDGRRQDFGRFNTHCNATGPHALP